MLSDIFVMQNFLLILRYWFHEHQFSSSAAAEFGQRPVNSLQPLAWNNIEDETAICGLLEKSDKGILWDVTSSFLLEADPIHWAISISGKLQEDISLEIFPT